jgi:hypothetical protein
MVALILEDLEEYLACSPTMFSIYNLYIHIYIVLGDELVLKSSLA